MMIGLHENIKSVKRSEADTLISSSAAMGEHTPDSAPILSSDSEAEAPDDHDGVAPRHQQEEFASGVSRVRAVLTILILCYINLLNYMDRFTVAGTDPFTGSTTDGQVWSVLSSGGF